MTKGGPPLIVHVIYRLDFGGLENGLVNLINRIPPDRYRHAIVCLAGFNLEFRKRIRRSDVEVISLDKRPGKDVGVYLRMLRVLRRLRPLIAHTRNLGTVDMQWVAAAAGVRYRVHGEHGWDASDPRGLNSKSLRIRRACRPVIQRYVPMSKHIAAWLEQELGVEASAIRQLYSGVDTEKFSPMPKASPEFDSTAAGGVTHPRSPAPAGKSSGSGCLITLGTVGRLDPIKNQDSVLRAFATILPAHPNLRLTVVGDGPLRSSLEATACNLGIAGQVTFTGSRNDTADLLRSFDVFVLPSINEGISNTILEAMATGLPVVAGSVGGNPELIADGVTGRLYDPADPVALGRALLPYVEQPALRQAHGKAGRDRVVQNFSLDAMIQRYMDLYDNLVAPSPAAGG